MPLREDLIGTTDGMPCRKADATLTQGEIRISCLLNESILVERILGRFGHVPRWSVAIIDAGDAESLREEQK